MMTNNRLRLASAASAIAICMACAGSAFAQDTDTQDETAQEQASAESGEGIGEIVVTAQRREESLQDAAVAIDAVTGDSLVAQGVTNAAQLTKLVPALTVTNGGGNYTSLFVRGVGNRTNGSYNDAAIGISYDGVYLAHPAGLFGAAFYDLERVEVLKGPQGILYGRNATGGAVNVIPARPNLGGLAAGFDVAFGNYDTVNAQGYVNLPVSDTIAVRLAGARQVQDGFNRDGSGDRDVWSVRGQILIEPLDDLSLRIGADYTHTGGQGTGGTYLGNFTRSPAGYVFTPAPLDINEGYNTAAANAYRGTLLGAPGFGFMTPLNIKPFIDFAYYGVNAELTWKTGIGTLTVIPAWRKTEGSSSFVGPAFNSALNFEDDEQFTLETRLDGSLGMIDYLVGGFYLRDTSKAVNEFNQEFVLPIQSYTHKVDSWALFGQLTFNISDRLRVIGGARYTHDKKEMDGLLNNFITFCGGLPPANLVPPASFANGCAAPNGLPRYPSIVSVPDTLSWLVANGWIAANSTLQPNTQVFPLLNGRGTILKTHSPLTASRTFTQPTYKASVEFDVAPDNLLYATFETGYRAGGLQLAEGRPEYKPEFLDSFTIGSKNRFLDDRVQLNLEAFYWKYRDQQITYFTVDPNGTLLSSSENAGRVNIKGMDIDAIVKPTRTTTLSAKVQYLDAKYRELHLYTAAPRDNFNCPFTFTGALAGGQPVKDFDCSGEQAVFAPKWTLNLGAEQIVPLGDFELTGAVYTSWRAAQNGNFEFLAFERIPAYWTTDLTLTLQPVDADWSIGAFVYNVENERRMTFPALGPTGQAVSTFSAPRTYGIRLAADF
jgi:iron complex outermembrane receptor protein